MTLIISLILLLINSFLVIKIVRSDRFHLLLRLLWAISFFGWNAVPFLLSLLPQYRNDISINYDFYLMCWSLNFFYLFIVYYSAMLFNKKMCKKEYLFIKPSYQYNPRFIKLIMNASLIVLVFIIFVNLGDQASYAERNDVDIHDDNLFLGVISFLTGYVIYFLLAILFFYHKLLSNIQRYIILSILSFHYILESFFGSRIQLFAILIILLYIAINQKRKKMLISVVALSLFAFTILPALSQLRRTGDSYSISDVMQIRSKGEGDYIWEIMNKTNSVASSSTLLFYSGIGSGGSLVYTSTLFSLVPRFIYPNKPHPGSMNGTMDGLPGRLAANINKNNYSSAANVGISSSIEALWAGGYIMYFIQAMFGGFLIVLMNLALRGKKLLMIYFVLSLLSFPVCMLDVSLVYFSIFVQRFFIVYILFYIIFSGKFRKFKMPQRF